MDKVITTLMQREEQLGAKVEELRSGIDAAEVKLAGDRFSLSEATEERAQVRFAIFLLTESRPPAGEAKTPEVVVAGLAGAIVNAAPQQRRRPIK
jgi:hypothetical protein